MSHSNALVAGMDLKRLPNWARECISLRYQDLLVVLLFTLSFGGGLGCANLSHLQGAGVVPLRIGQLLGQGDPARRASLRLVDEGLEADALADPDRALARYERAIQVDATNPYVYLAIARHKIEVKRPEEALQFLQRADSLLEQSGARSPEVEVHIVGMRGGALYDQGQIDMGVELLERARRISPEVWGDGVLSSEEFR